MNTKLKKILIFLVIFCTFQINLKAQENAYSMRATSYYSTIYPLSQDSILFTRDDFFTFIWSDTACYNCPYNFLLVRLNAGQNPKAAIMENDTIFFRDSIFTYYLNYPWDALHLQAGQYVWGVKRQNETNYKVAAFTIYPRVVAPPRPIRMPNFYADLQEKLDGSYQIAYDGRLKIHYRERDKVDNFQKLRFRIWNDWRTVILAETDEGGNRMAGNFPEIPLHYGDNWLTINLESCPNISGYCTLEVWNGVGEVHFLRFICKPSPYLELPNGRFP